MGIVERRVFPGGCFFASAAAELDTRQGPVRDAVASFLREWLATPEGLAARTRQDGDLDRAEDPAQVAFELDAFLLMANLAFVLHNDPHVIERARVATHVRIDSARPRPR